MRPETIEQRIRTAVSESEGRTSRAVEDLRGDLREWRGEFMPRERIEDKWHRDDARLKEHDAAIDALQKGHAEMQRGMAQLATKEDIKATVAEATGGFARKSDIDTALSEARHTRLTTTQQLALLALGIAGFLTTTGIIHPLALFTGGH